MTPYRRLLPVLLVLATACGTLPEDEPFLYPEPIDRGHAEALANAGVLRIADMKGWTETKPQPETGEDRAAARAIATCVGGPEPVFVAEKETNWTKDGVLIASEASVAQTLDMAKQEGEGSEDLAPCIDDALRRTLPLPTGVTLEPIQATPVQVSVPGTEAYGMRLVISARGPGGTVRSTLSSVSARVGNVIVSINASTDKTPPDAATLIRLLTVGVNRVKAVQRQIASATPTPTATPTP